MKRQWRSVEWVLMWTYQVQRVPVGRRDEPILPRRKTSSDGTYLLATLGAAVQGGAAVAGSGYHPDAEAVADAVARIRGISGVLLERFGRSGVVPDWYPSAHQVDEIRFVNNKKQKYIKTVSLSVNGGCFEEVPGGWETVEFGRAEYLTFYSGLEFLKKTLVLGDFIIDSIDTPDQPWLKKILTGPA